MERNEALRSAHDEGWSWGVENPERETRKHEAGELGGCTVKLREVRALRRSGKCLKGQGSKE